MKVKQVTVDNYLSKIIQPVYAQIDVWIIIDE
jgi:hypothetical protein